MGRLTGLLLFATCGCVLLSFHGCSSSVPQGGPPPDGKVVVRAQAEGDTKRPETGPPFRLPADQGGALLSKVLPPAKHSAVLRNPSSQGPRFPPPPSFDGPPLPLPPTVVTLPRLMLPPSGSTPKPQVIHEESLSQTPGDPLVPRRPSFYSGKRAREYSVDARLPPPLPLLAQPVPDRASLDDATLEVSTAAALAAPLPRRTAPAPYNRVTVPDPYEHRLPLLLAGFREKDAPQVGTPQVDKP